MGGGGSHKQVTVLKTSDLPNLYGFNLILPRSNPIFPRSNLRFPRSDLILSRTRYDLIFSRYDLIFPRYDLRYPKSGSIFLRYKTRLMEINVISMRD